MIRWGRIFSEPVPNARFLTCILLTWSIYPTIDKLGKHWWSNASTRWIPPARKPRIWQMYNRTKHIVMHLRGPFNFTEISGRYHKCFSPVYAARASDIQAFIFATSVSFPVKLAERVNNDWFLLVNYQGRLYCRPVLQKFEGAKHKQSEAKVLGRFSRACWVCPTDKEEHARSSAQSGSHSFTPFTSSISGNLLKDPLQIVGDGINQGRLNGIPCPNTDSRFEWIYWFQFARPYILDSNIPNKFNWFIGHQYCLN